MVPKLVPGSKVQGVIIETLEPKFRPLENSFGISPFDTLSTMFTKKRSYSNANPQYKKPRLVRPPSMGPIARQSVAVGAWHVAKGPEYKFVDVDGVTSATSIPLSNDWTTPGATFLLNGLVPGSLATQRIGRKVSIKTLYVRATVQLATTSVRGGNIRMMVFYDKQANGTAPLVTDVLVDDSFYSPNNLSNRDRFVVLCDHVFEAIGTQADYQKSMVLHKKLNLETMFNAGTAGTIADITSGSIYIMFAQSGTIGTGNPTASWYSRIRYTDQ